jgi:glutathione S-transferase
MSLVFFHAPNSTAVITHWVLEELGVPYEKVNVDLKARDQDKPAFRALNPNGKVPTIVHDDIPVFESAAITLHLGETFGVPRNLFPPPGTERARAMSWIVWCNVSIGEAVQRLQHASASYVPADQHNAKAAEAARADIERLVGILDAQLAKRPYLLGESFSLVDAHVGSLTAWLGMLGFDQARWTHLDAWMKRITARPGYVTSMSP